MRAAVITFAGALALWVVLNTMRVNDTVYAVVATAVITFAAGWMSTRRGALIGFACVFVASLLWSTQVIARAWLGGDLAKPFPDCDPCGLAGHLVRMTIVTAMGLATFGVLGALAGWLGAFARRRAGRA